MLVPIESPPGAAWAPPAPPLVQHPLGCCSCLHGNVLHLFQCMVWDMGEGVGGRNCTCAVTWLCQGLALPPLAAIMCSNSGHACLHWQTLAGCRLHLAHQSAPLPASWPSHGKSKPRDGSIRIQHGSPLDLLATHPSAAPREAGSRQRIATLGGNLGASQPGTLPPLSARGLLPSDSVSCVTLPADKGDAPANAE